MEACQAGPCQKSVRPLPKLGGPWGPGLLRKWPKGKWGRDRVGVKNTQGSLLPWWQSVGVSGPSWRAVGPAVGVVCSRVCSVRPRSPGSVSLYGPHLGDKNHSTWASPLTPPLHSRPAAQCPALPSQPLKSPAPRPPLSPGSSLYSQPVPTLPHPRDLSEPLGTSSLSRLLTQ